MVSSTTVNDAIVSTIARQVTFENTSDLPPTSARTLTVDTENANGDTQSATASITITAVNNPPALTGLDATPAHADSPVLLDADATVSDVELDNDNNYDGATLTLGRNGGGQQPRQLQQLGNSGGPG